MNEFQPLSPMAIRRNQLRASSERLDAKELQEIVSVVQEVMQTAAGLTGAVLTQVRKSAGKRLLRAASELGNTFERSSAGSKLLSNSIISWFKGTRTDEFGCDPAFRDAVRPFFQFLYHEYFRVDAKGAEGVPEKGPALIVSNHSGGLPYDGPMISLAIYNNNRARRDVRFLVDDFVPELPVIGTFIQRMGGIRACHENAMRLLAAGQLLGVFPEGLNGVSKPFEQRYQLQHFGRGGFIRLAMRTGVPIVPVAVVGAEEIHPIIWTSERLGKPFGMPYFAFTPTFPWLGPLGVIPMPVKWKITFGKPIDFSHFDPADAEDYELVRRESEAIRQQIQRMLTKTLAERTSLWED